MAKKKSKRFIIPSFHFLTTLPDTKIAPTENNKKPVEKTAAVVSRPEPVSNKPALPAKAAIKEISKPKPLDLKNSGRRNSALSLSSLKRNKEEAAAKLKKNNEQSSQTKNVAKDPFTEATFLNVWNSYVDDLHQKGEKILASILKADSPKLKGHLIHVSYPNELMKVELLKVRPKVLRHIREKLNNYEVDFEITVNEDNTKRFAYTPQEKYELLKDKNKALALLRKKFNLEL